MMSDQDSSGNKFSKALLKEGGEAGRELAYAFREYQLDLQHHLSEMRDSLHRSIIDSSSSGRYSLWVSGVTLAIVCTIVAGGFTIYKDIGRLEAHLERVISDSDSFRTKLNEIETRIGEILSTVQAIDNKIFEMTDRTSVEPGGESDSGRLDFSPLVTESEEIFNPPNISPGQEIVAQPTTVIAEPTREILMLRQAESGEQLSTLLEQIASWAMQIPPIDPDSGPGAQATAATLQDFVALESLTLANRIREMGFEVRLVADVLSSEDLSYEVLMGNPSLARQALLEAARGRKLVKPISVGSIVVRDTDDRIAAGFRGIDREDDDLTIEPSLSTHEFEEQLESFGAILVAPETLNDGELLDLSFEGLIIEFPG